MSAIDQLAGHRQPHVPDAQKSCLHCSSPLYWPICFTTTEGGGDKAAMTHPEQALAALDRLLTLHPDHIAARLHRGKLLNALQRPDEAASDLNAVLHAHPDDIEALTERAAAHLATGRRQQAIDDLDRALYLNPTHLTALLPRAHIAQDQSDHAAALALYDRALVRQPDLAAAQSNRGVTLRAMGRHTEALQACRQAHELCPGDADMELNLAICLLHAGLWQQGWPAYEARLRRPPWNAAMATFTAPLWDGTTRLDGTRILLVGEQGLGDTIQFCRFAPRLTALGANVILGVDPSLRRLLTGIAQIAIPTDPDPHYDFFCPLLSLPARLGLTPADTAMPLPYLRADPAATALWRTRLAPYPNLKVGLVWAGDPRPDDPAAQRLDQRRSIPLDRLAPLLATPNATFVSLQKGRQAAACPVLDWTAELHDFADTAALIEALDLVISVDTAVAHLAGAMGKPVWALHRFDRCWRWLTEPSETIWYPSMRLFTQLRPSDWSQVVAEVTNALIHASGTVHAS
jgi:Flp pilus assembly protein TadD